MAVEIQLPERRAIGPTRVGRAKPGFDLVDSGLQETGEAITELAMFTGKHFADIRKAKTANEEAEGLGAFKGLVESFNTFSKANPNASPEQLRLEWGKVKSQINKLPSQIGTSSASKENLTSVFANNMKLAEQKADSFAAAVGSAQQKARSEQQIKGLITDLDDKELTQHYMRQVAAGTYDKELIFGPEGKGGGRLDNELDFIAATKEKERLRIEAEIAEVEYGNAQQDAFNVWGATVTAENPEGDISAGFESINKDPRIPNEDKQEAESELKSRINNRRAEVDEAIKEAILKADNAIQKKITDKDTADIVEFIRSQNALDELQKGTWIDAVEKDAAAKLRNDEQNSPFNQGSNSVFQKWLNAAQTDPKSFDMNDMTELTKKGKTDGITTSQWRTINTLRNTALNNIDKGTDPLDTRTAKLGNEYLDLFKTDDPEGWIQSLNDYNKWYLDFTEANKKEPTPRESEAKLLFLTTEPVKTFWINDLPDAEIKTELRGIPLEGQKAFVESAQREESTTAWLKKWRAKPKKFTRSIAVHYLSVTGNDVEKADELAIRDGYTE